MLTKSKVFATLALFGAVTALAGTAFAKNGENVGKVEDVRWFSHNGYGYIKLDSTVTDAGGNCSSRYARVRDSDGERDTVMSLATAALLSGKTVTLRTNGCAANYPILTAIQVSRY